MTNGFDFLPNGWSDFERESYVDSFAEIGGTNDTTLQALFNEGYFNFDITSDDRIAIRHALDEYLAQEYGISFDDVFDWHAWREAYGEMS